MVVGTPYSLIGGDGGINQTVEKIKSAVYGALHNPDQKVRLRAESIIRNFNVPERNDVLEGKAVFDWVKNHFHYVHDPANVEYVKTPDYIDDEITSYGKFIGDCDDASGYLAALMKSIGYDVRLTVMNDVRSTHNEFQHIYTEFYSPQKR